MSDKWKRELEQIAAVQFRPAIRFSASIRLPLAGKMALHELYEKNPEEYIRRWLDASVFVIYGGPLINPRGEYSGELTVMPKIQVKHFPPK